MNTCICIAKCPIEDSSTNNGYYLKATQTPRCKSIICINVLYNNNNIYLYRALYDYR